MSYPSLRPERLQEAHVAAFNGSAFAWDLPTVEDTIELLAERDRLREALRRALRDAQVLEHATGLAVARGLVLLIQEALDERPESAEEGGR